MNEQQIKQLIENYQSTPSICKVLGVSFDRRKLQIESIASELNLLEHLIENNRTSKKGALNIFKIEKTIGIEICNDIEAGLSMKDVMKRYSISKNPLKKYLLKMGLMDVVHKNKKLGDAARLNANSNVVKQKCLYKFKYDHEAITQFAIAKSSFYTKAELIRLCMAEFGISETTGEKILRKLTCKKHDNSGINNKMYGVSPNKASGVGANGRLVYRGYNLHFRSSLELRVFLYLIDNNVRFCLSNHKVAYEYKEAKRTYNPDIVIDTTVYEIKPSKLKDVGINLIKFQALKAYCNENNLRCAYIDEHTYDLTFFTKDYFVNMVKSGYIDVNDKNYQKIFKYLKNE